MLGIVDVDAGRPGRGHHRPGSPSSARRRSCSTGWRDGAKYVFPSNHLALPDQGFTLGYFHKAAHACSEVDRLENYTTVMVGRLLGYYAVGGLNVIDGILRKAAGLLKTFPVSGGETLDESRIGEDDLDLLLRLFRKMCNHQTKQEFDRLMRSSTGHMVLLAGGGSHDVLHPDGQRRDAPVRPDHLRDDRRPGRRGDRRPAVRRLRARRQPGGVRRPRGRSPSPTTCTWWARRSPPSATANAASPATLHPEIDRFAGEISYPAR